MLEVLLLGPTEVRISGTAVSLSPLEQNVLAILALADGTVVSTERIIDSLWEERHPAAPRSRVQGIISALRRKVGAALATRHPGYLLDSSRYEIDISRLNEALRAARLATRPADAADRLREALSLWRGEPLDGLTAPGVAADRARLAELRLGLLEDLYDAELELGNHAALVAEIATTKAAHPLRERLAGQLMMALYRCHRQADALGVYHALRRFLADELGSDPCPEIRELHAAILRGDPIEPSGQLPPGAGEAAARTPAMDPVDAAAVVRRKPAQLPASVGHFTGRDADLKALTTAVEHSRDEPQILVVSGVGGLGKTALVVRWAHAIADAFPDGQIFLELHGSTPGRLLSPLDALGVALTALGVPGDDIPMSIDQAAALYRTLLYGKRVLIVADDAESVDHLVPLVPPGPGSQLVVTSRLRLAALAAQYAVCTFAIEPLTPDATHELLARIVGVERMRDPAAAEVVRWCGGWPLAIRFAGAKLAARPGQSLASFADELGEHPGELVLGDDPRSIRAALTSAYHALSPAAAQLFGRLGQHHSPTVRLHLSAATADMPVRLVRELLDELTAVHLVVEDGPGRYRLHEVVRRFARECGRAWRIRIGSEADS